MSPRAQHTLSGNHHFGDGHRPFGNAEGRASGAARSAAKARPDQVFRHVGPIGEMDAGFFMLAQAQPGLSPGRSRSIAVNLNGSMRHYVELLPRHFAPSLEIDRPDLGGG